MFDSLRPCFAEINLNNIINNINEIKAVSNGKNIIGIVKADGYGHGAIEISKVLIENGVSYLGVATVEEAIELREASISIPILILGPTHPTQLQQAINYDITMTIFDSETAKKINDICKIVNKTAKVHIALDTGMGRIGYFLNNNENEIVEDILLINKLNDYITIEGIFTHFSTSDCSDLSYTHLQYNKFKLVVSALIDKGMSFKYIHSSNSGGVINMNEDFTNCIRPGIIIYGYYPSDEVPRKLNLKPALQWKCNITHIKIVPEGTSIGYSRRYITNKETIIATIPIGYADGLRRGLFEHGKVNINGKLAPILGAVCMDQTMVDVSDIDTCKVGNDVYVIGDSYNAENMAYDLNTIPYEVLCGISKRVPRIYIKK